MLKYFAAVIAIIAAIITPAGPANAQLFPTIKIGDYSGIDTVAVFSGLGGSLHLDTEGTLISKTEDRDIRGWALDDEAKARLREYLPPRFQIVDLPYDRGAFEKMAASKWYTIFSSDLQKFLKSLPPDRVDAYILLLPKDQAQPPVYAGPVLVAGDKNVRSTLSLSYQILIVDARTLKTLASAPSRLRFRPTDNESLPPLFILPPELKIQEDLIFRDVQWIGVHLELSTLLNISVVETLRDLQMGLNLPPPGFRTLVKIPPEQNPYRNDRSVAIVSGIGDTLDMEKLGTLVFSNKSIQVPIPQWHLDQLVEDRAKDFLSTRFTVKDIAVDREMFSKSRLTVENGMLSPKFFGLPTSQDVDLYVVFVKSTAHLTGINQQETGVGVLNTTESLAPNLPDTEAFAIYTVAVLDAHTLTIRAAAAARLSPAHATASPVKLLDTSIWPKAAPNMTDRQRDAIHGALQDILFDSVPETLLQLGLTGARPFIGSPAPQGPPEPKAPAVPINFSAPAISTVPLSLQ